MARGISFHILNFRSSVKSDETDLLSESGGRSERSERSNSARSAYLRWVATIAGGVGLLFVVKTLSSDPTHEWQYNELKVSFLVFLPRYRNSPTGESYRRQERTVPKVQYRNETQAQSPDAVLPGRGTFGNALSLTHVSQSCLALIRSRVLMFVRQRFRENVIETHRAVRPFRGAVVFRSRKAGEYLQLISPSAVMSQHVCLSSAAVCRHVDQSVMPTRNNGCGYQQLVSRGHRPRIDH